MAITKDTLKADNRCRQIAAEVISTHGQGPWNAGRAQAALALIAGALWPEPEHAPRIKALCAVAGENGICTNASQFSQWASATPKGASAQRVPGVTRQRREDKAASDVAALLAELDAPAPEPES